MSGKTNEQRNDMFSSPNVFMNPQRKNESKTITSEITTIIISKSGCLDMYREQMNVLTCIFASFTVVC